MNKDLRYRSKPTKEFFFIKRYLLICNPMIFPFGLSELGRDTKGRIPIILK